MDNPQPFESNEPGFSEANGNDAIEAPPAVGADERRMHVRAYNHWTSLLKNNAYPSIEDLDPAAISDFGPNSVLLDFTGGESDPIITWLGGALRSECDVDDDIENISDVPPRSLLSRLTDHYMQIIANQSPVGFEAEFENHRGVNMMYRGILMPFSSDNDTIDFIYGVINWKEVVDQHIQAELTSAVDQALQEQPQDVANSGPVWADGPTPRNDAIAALDAQVEKPETLVDFLAAARVSAAEARTADQRSRSALYDALGRAHDFAIGADAEPEAYAEILDDAGITAQARAPMTPIAKLVFGVDYDKTRLTEFASALAFAKREHIAAGAFAALLKEHKGGLKAVVAEERAARRPASKPDKLGDARELLRNAPIQGYVELDYDCDSDGEFALLMARRLPDGRLAIIGAVPEDAALVAKAIRKTAADKTAG